MAINLGEGNLLTVRANYAVIGVAERAMNVFHYRVQGMVGAAPNITSGLASVADAFLTFWGFRWAAFASEDVGLLNITVTNVFPLPRSVSVTSTNLLPTLGEVESETLPMQDAITILKKTDVGARWGLGRAFIPGIPESTASAGIITPAGVANAGLMEAGLKATIPVVGDGWTANIVPVLLRGPEDNPVSLTDIRDTRLSSEVIKTQRRRRPGKGS